MNRFKNNLKNRCYFSAFSQASVGQREASFSRRLSDKQGKKKKAGSPQASLWRKKLLCYSLETPERN